MLDETRSEDRITPACAIAFSPPTRATGRARSARGGTPGRAGRSQGAKRATARTGGLPTRRRWTIVGGPLRQRCASWQLLREKRAAARSFSR